ncbi:hypothetical protein TCAL_08224 [Tigriopus californicus]|uniref:Mediator of RNA polymerase II transcription subunit 15 n=1 Tax=Tigriopus californicus TaxID=6832 RepID=A0A553NFF1_TIGCA|nr:hypothetical protein TCAL_08224 [Tigriopus californicus]|eukprot:TCALIF_08224-PA protein Name:"Similar to MED15 Mediator of RNA polymerase II transcription subunit 15 (Aedes aegypti)" AED:0.19 eAED:0.19 QI:0/0/0/1/1/1/3/0/263
MGGYPGINLASHRRDDRHYDRKRRELRRHLPALKQYLGKLSSIVEAVWRSQGFRMAVSKKLMDTLQSCGHTVPANGGYFEENIFKRAKTKESYLELAARVILYIRSIVEAVWRSQGFRMAVSKKLMDTLQSCGHTVPANGGYFEENIFKRAKTKESYLELAARVILYIREQHTKAEINLKMQHLKDTLTQRAAQKRAATGAQGRREADEGHSASKKLKVIDAPAESLPATQSRHSREADNHHRSPPPTKPLLSFKNSNEDIQS